MIRSAETGLLLALCICTGVRCMPKVQGRGKRQAQQPVYPHPDQASSVQRIQEGACIMDSGVSYSLGMRWIRTQGSKQMLCTCLGNKVSCQVWAHEEVCTTSKGVKYRVGDQWDKPHDMFGHMMRCTCIGNGQGEWTCIAYSQLRAIPAPTNLEFSQVGPSNVLISWRAPNSRLTGYRVVLNPKTKSGPPIEINLAPDTTEAPVQRLMVATTYVVQVYALKGSLASRPVEGEVTTIDNISPPRRVRITDVKDSSITLTWRSKTEPITGYLIETTSGTNSHPPIVSTIPPELRSYTITGLEPSTSYTVNMYTLNGAGRSPPLTLHTSTGKPLIDAPTNIRFTSLTPNSISFTWSPPLSAITAYTITYQEPGKPAKELTPSPLPDRSYAAITEGACIMDSGVSYSLGMRWIRTQGSKQMLCTCLCNKVSCQEWAHEEVCTTSEGVMYRVGDQWVKPHNMLGHMMRCTCIGNGRGERTCIAYSQLRDQCTVDGLTYEVNHTFTKRHDEGYMMNCTCFGQGRGRWKCDAIDQCQEPDTRAFYQIGETWDKHTQGIHYRCHCYGNGNGELSCEPQNYGAILAPTNLEFSQVGPSNVLISWRAPNARLTGYRVVLNPKTKSGPPIEINLAPDTTETPVQRLMVATTYVVQVYALKGSLTSRPVEGEVTTIDNISPPRRVRITDVKDSSITLTWRSKTEPITGYLIETTSGTNSHPPIVSTIPPELRSYTITELEPSTSYTVNMYTLNGAGRSPPLTLQTSTGKPLIDAPTNIRFTSLTPNSISFTWSPPRSAITAYTITYQEPGKPAKELTPSPLPDRSYATITGTTGPGRGRATTANP